MSLGGTFAVGVFPVGLIPSQEGRMRVTKTKETIIAENRLIDTLYAADSAGRYAGTNATQQMLTIQNTLSGKVYEPFPICGFASVHVRGIRKKAEKEIFAEFGFKKDSYRGGIYLWVSDYGQSYDQKKAHAEAFAKVLNENGIDAYSESRLD